MVSLSSVIPSSDVKLGLKTRSRPVKRYCLIRSAKLAAFFVLKVLARQSFFYKTSTWFPYIAKPRMDGIMKDDLKKSVV